MTTKKLTFDYSTKGYLEAKDFLISIDEWERVSKQSQCDGWSIVQTANDIFDRMSLQKSRKYQ